MKYMGSKARLAKHILPIILENRKPRQHYVEPFCGGMNTICKVEGPRIAADANKYLIAMWKALLQGWQPKKITKEEYQKVRLGKEGYLDAYVGWVGFNCSYSGKWFGGFAGDTVTKVGTIRDYQSEAINNVMAQIPALKGIKCQTALYNTLKFPDGSIVYCDPPYEGTTEYAGEFNHSQFWDWVRHISKTNRVFVSEYKAPPDFKQVWEKSVSSSLSANGKCGGNKISTEKLFHWERMSR